MRVQLGNLNPVGVAHPSVTTATIPDTYTPREVLLTIVDPGGVWTSHSNDLRPAWVECDVHAIAMDIAEYYGIRTGRPENWKDTP